MGSRFAVFAKNGFYSPNSCWAYRDGSPENEHVIFFGFSDIIFVIFSLFLHFPSALNPDYSLFKMNANISFRSYGRYCAAIPVFFAHILKISFFCVMAVSAVSAYGFDVSRQGDIPENAGAHFANFPDYVQPLPQGEPNPGKLSVVKFYTDYCYPCAEVDAGAFADANLIRYLRQYYNPYKVDGFDETGGGRELAWEYGVHTFPTVLIADPNGRELARVSGNVSTAALLEMLKEYEARSLTYRSAVRAAAIPVLPVAHVTGSEPAATPAEEAQSPTRFGLVVQLAPDYYAARELARVYRNNWGDDVWIEPTRKGTFSLICGAYHSREAAKTAREFFIRWEGIRFRILSLSDTGVSY